MGVGGCVGIEGSARERSIVGEDRFTTESAMPCSPPSGGRGVEGPEEDPLALFTSQAPGHAWIVPLGSFISGPVLPEEAHTRSLEELAAAVRSSGASLLGTWPDIRHEFAAGERFVRTSAYNFNTNMFALVFCRSAAAVGRVSDE